jgi:hypothetical protein
MTNKQPERSLEERVLKIVTGALKTAKLAHPEIELPHSTLGSLAKRITNSLEETLTADREAVRRGERLRIAERIKQGHFAKVADEEVWTNENVKGYKTAIDDIYEALTTPLTNDNE